MNESYPRPPVHTHLVIENERELTLINHVTYALYMLSYFTAGLTWLVAIIINYVKRPEANGTWLHSHFDWQITTFWYSIFMGVIATVLLIWGLPVSLIAFASDHPAVQWSLFSFGGMLVFLGVLLWIFVALWHLYRIVRGWLALLSRKAVP